MIVTTTWLACGAASFPVFLFCGTGRQRLAYFLILLACCLFLGLVALLISLGGLLAKLEDRWGSRWLA